MRIRQVAVPLLLLALSACDKPGERGAQGPPGAEGPAGPAGPTGPSGAIIRFIDSECSGACIVACEATERILNTYAMNPGGAFTMEDDNRATFRPQQQGTPIKVSVACILRW